MKPELFVEIALVPGLKLLPPRMDSPEARAMVIAICLQESKLMHRRQIRGPARGYAQFELTGVRGVLAHTSSGGHVMSACAAIDVLPKAAACHHAIEHNDVLACVFARLLLWTLPTALPSSDESEKGWGQYLDAWRPGKPHPATWPGNFERAWQIVRGGELL